MIHGQPVSIHVMSPREEVVQLLEEKRLASLPVVDLDGKLSGIIRYDALVTAAKHEATGDLQAMFGAGRDERALSKASFAIRKRLPWLEINLATAFLAAAVVGLFEDTIARITALAVFLPVVAGQSGNTGSQALAVTMRGLALREVRTRHWFRIARKEVAVGFVNGVAVAVTTSLVRLRVDALVRSLRRDRYRDDLLHGHRRPGRRGHSGDPQGLWPGPCAVFLDYLDHGHRCRGIHELPRTGYTAFDCAHDRVEAPNRFCAKRTRSSTVFRSLTSRATILRRGSSPERFAI